MTTKKKPIIKEPETETLTARCTEKLKNEVRECAIRRGLSEAQVIRRAVEAYVSPPLACDPQ